MRIALAQINTTVGDLDGNRERILSGIEEAKAARADIVLFLELAVTSYPPEDLLLRPGFVRAAAESLRELTRETRGLSALVGFPHFDRDLYNACAVCTGGEVKAIYRKRFLPNYGVFDEDRYFAPARDLLLLQHGETLIGPTICEDLWQPGPPATESAARCPRQPLCTSAGRRAHWGISSPRSRRGSASSSRCGSPSSSAC